MSRETRVLGAPGIPDAPRAEDEARSPPGRWRLLAAALPCWAFTAFAITVPGAAGAGAWMAALLGVALLAWRGWQALAPRPRLPDRSCGAASGATDPGTARSRTSASLLVLLCAAVVLVGVQVSVAERTRDDPILASAAEHGRSIAFEAELSGYPEYRAGPFSTRGWVRISAHSASGAVPMLLWLEEPLATAGWGPGTRIELRATLERQPPGDGAAYTADARELREIERISFGAAVGAATARLRVLLAAHAATVPGAELVPGFAVGDTSLVSERLEQAMLESSLTHLTAVSGSNTGLVIAVVVWCAARIGAGRRLRIVCAAAGLAGFVAIVGPDASVQRAAVMAAVLLVGGFGGRRASALPALGLAVLLLLALDPWQALHPGFALSVAATGGILMWAAPLSAWLRRRARLPRWLALPVAVALAAQLACGPLLLLLQPGIPAVGVLANVIAAPAAPVGTGMGLLAALLGPVSPGLATAAVHLASYPARWVAATAHVCAELPGGRWNWPEGWAGAALLAACEVALLLAWAIRTGRLGLPFTGRVERRRPWQRPLPVPTGIRTAVATLTSAALATVLAITLVHPLGSKLATPNDWAVVACDVGQGDAILLRDPRAPQEVMLVDTGDDAEALERCLGRFGVRHIALLMLSHDDRDHVGVLDAVVHRVEAALIAPPVRGEETASREVVRTLERAGVPYAIGTAGARRSSPLPGPLPDPSRVPHPDPRSGLQWEVLAPTATAAPPDTNAASLVALVQAGPARVLLLGDTGLDEQAALLREHGAALRADVLKVAHHGSRDQDQRLPNEVGARWGLVSAGAENRYGHPNAETLGALARAGTTALRTDLHGSIAIVAQPDSSLVPWVERTADETAGEG